MSLILCYKSRGITKLITLLDGQGRTITPSSSDKIRVLIGYEGTLDTAPKLGISSDDETENGSYFSKNSPSSGVHTLRLDASDLNFAAGLYTLSVELYDAQDTNEWKECSRQIFNLADT